MWMYCIFEGFGEVKNITACASSSPCVGVKRQIPVELWCANANGGEPLKIHEEIITGRCPTFFSAAAPPLPWGDSVSKQRGLTPQRELTLPPGAAEGAGVRGDSGDWQTVVIAAA
ncbi:hypothetical protein Q5P01_020510 [Channa striata]|uniref:Uncharacterized protein n=1 Tax=Channa striata TaxID=64152 RepID=A0AA88LXR7_CHASR|nr:hypothetical protein Q5P01_020510 [Channa striata]